MAIDLEAIKKKLSNLNGSAKNDKKMSNVQLWKPELGEYRIRILPWKDAKDGQPFHERQFYYIGENKGLLAPYQFGKPDPINDLIKKLYSGGKAEDKALAKKLLPKLRVYAPVIVRGQESQGVMVWSFGKMVYQRLLGFFVDAEIGDVTDPNEGFDLVVKITKQQGKQFNDTTVDAARRPSKLSDDSKQVEAWLNSIPNIDDMYRLKEPSELEAVLNSWLNGDVVLDTSATVTTSRGPTPVDPLDEVVESVKPAAKKPAKKTDADAQFKSLDDAFDDLLAD
jgi:hypothetical protein